MNLKRNKGITLIDLVIIIIVLIIISAISLLIVFAQNGIITETENANVTTTFGMYKEEVELFKVEHLLENRDFKAETLTAGKNNTNYNTKNLGKEETIKDIIPDIKDEYLDCLEIIKGKLVITTKNKKLINQAQMANIEVNPYDIEKGTLKATNKNIKLLGEDGTLIIPDSVTKIEKGAYSNVQGLLRLIINENVKEIGENAFSNDENLSYVYLDGNIEKIRRGAFNQCDNLSEIILTNNSKYTYENGLLLENIDKDDPIFISKKYLESTSKFVMPEGMKIFCINLSDYKNINTIEIPKTVEKIKVEYLPSSIGNVILNNGNKVFELYDQEKMIYNRNKETLIMCYSKEEKINVLDGTKKIGNHAFYQSSNIKELNLPKTVEKIEDQILRSTQEIESINIGENVKYISPIFKCNNYYGNINIDSENPNYNVEKGLLLNKNNTKLITVLYRINEGFTVPNNIVTIGEMAFYKQDKMTGVNITSVETIEQEAFKYCIRLEKIAIPASVAEIGEKAFEVCFNLEEIKVDKTKNTIKGSPWGATKGKEIVKWN